MNTLKNLTPEKLSEIYTDKKFRNTVAFAHVCLDVNSQFKHKKTCDYPISYIVTDEQINEAKKELEKDKENLKNNLSNKLVFVGMGMTIATEQKDSIANHRIRTNFINSKGTKCFIEVGRGSNILDMRIDHAIFNYGSDDEKNNYNGLERAKHNAKFTLPELLNLVNSSFDCNFKAIEVDNFTLSTDDFICKSPKQ